GPSEARLGAEEDPAPQRFQRAARGIGRSLGFKHRPSRIRGSRTRSARRGLVLLGLAFAPDSLDLHKSSRPVSARERHSAPIKMLSGGYGGPSRSALRSSRAAPCPFGKWSLRFLRP